MRLLIADDEDYTREGLIESMPWEEYGISEIRQARDGKEALDIAISFRPDIVLTDIKMPKLNGIEFAEKLIKECPDSKLLFISGYMEIEYLKSSIRLSAIDYIEKPINPVVLEAAIKKAVDAIAEKRKQVLSDEERIELKKQKLVTMLSNKNKDMDSLYIVCQELGYKINDRYMTVVIWDREKYASEEDNIAKIYFFWKEKRFDALCASMSNGLYYVIIRLTHDSGRKIKGYCENLTQLYGSLYIGIGHAMDNLINLHESFDRAMMNINYMFYNPGIKVFSMQEDIIIEKGIDPLFYTEFNTIIKTSPQELSNWMRQLFEKICTEQCYKKQHLQILFSTYAKIILKEKKNLLKRLTDIYSEDDLEQQIMQSVSIFDIKDIMLSMVKMYEEELEEEKGYSKLVRDVMDYVNAHYTDFDLSIEEIAGHMHFSSAHLSVLFKQETGITIKQYIGDYRLELSKKMLESEHYKITEIAELCGYSNANYFAKVFKAATNLSPMEYRKRVE